MNRVKDVVIVGPPHSGRTELAGRLSERLGLSVLPGSRWPVTTADHEPVIFDGCPWVEKPLDARDRRAVPMPYGDTGGAVAAARSMLYADAVTVFCLPSARRFGGIGPGHAVLARYLKEFAHWPGVRSAYQWNDSSFSSCLAICRFEATGGLTYE